MKLRFAESRGALQGDVLDVETRGRLGRFRRVRCRPLAGETLQLLETLLLFFQPTLFITADEVAVKVRWNRWHLLCLKRGMPQQDHSQHRDGPRCTKNRPEEAVM